MNNILKALLIGPLCGLFLCLPAHAQKTKAQLATEIGTTYPDNSIGSITPLGVRTYETDLINSIMPTAPVSANNLACFNGTTGLLKDCGIAPSTNPLVIGTTPITGGTTTRVLYDNGGVIGEYAISGTGSVVMSGSPTITSPTISTILNGGTLTVPTGTDTLVGKATTDTLTNKTFDTAGTGNSFSINGVAATANTGTGAVVRASAPTLVAPLLGTPASGVATNLTGLPISTGLTGLGTGVATAAGVNLSASGGLTTTIASGAKALATTAIGSAACSAAQTDTATNAVTTDTIIVSFNGDPTAVTGYVPLTSGMLTIIPYPTANTVNFKVCNNTSSSITPGAITLNWRVVR